MSPKRAARSNMARLEALVAELPEAVRVDVAEWGDHPTFRVRNKNFVFCDDTATSLTVKLSKDEAEAVVATDPAAEPAGYGLGRHGWVSVASRARRRRRAVGRGGRVDPDQLHARGTQAPGAGGPRPGRP